MTSLLDLAGARYVSLTTFRASGVGVATPVWVVRDGDALSVTTPDGTGKVKRLRNDSRVELRPCSYSGTVADDAPTLGGTAEILTDAEVDERSRSLLRKKYGIEYRILMLLEKLTTRGTRRVTLHITPA